MKIIAGILTANLANGSKRRMLELYASELSSKATVAGSKEAYEAKELSKLAKDMSKKIMNIESYSMMYPVKYDGKLASDKDELYSLMAEGVMR